MKHKITWEQAQHISESEIKQRKTDQEEADRNKEEAHNEVRDRIFNCSEPFNYSDIEDIMSGYGLEMDGIEDLF